MSATAAGLLGHAVGLGLVRTRDVLDGRVTVREQSRSNVVHRIDVDGRAVAFVKEAGLAHRLDGGDPVGRERAALLGLQGVVPGPRLLPGTATQLWTAPVAGVPVAELDLSHTPVDEVAGAWGAALAAVHIAPARGAGAVPAPRPWVLDADRPPAWLGDVAQRPAVASAVGALRDDPALAAAVAEVSASWCATGWIHGDAGTHNVLVSAGGAALIDFEDAGLGDPSWDLACALASLELLVTSWGLPSGTGAAELLGGYTVAGGPGRAGRAVRAVAAALVACQLGLGGSDATADASRDGRSRELLQRAVALAGSCTAVGAP